MNRLLLIPFLFAALGLLQEPQTPSVLPTQSRPTVGKEAPHLRLNDATGEARVLGGESGSWTVLAFYPKARTPG